MKVVRFAGVCLSLLSMLLPLLSACGAQPTPTVPPTAPTAEPTRPRPTLAAVPTELPTPEPTATPKPTPAPKARFESSPCPFGLPAGQVESETVECGYLVVPEDRADPAGPTIHLAVAIFHPDGTPEADPIFYLQGGPGASALELVQLTFTQLFHPLLAANRDLVLFDQRGVGLSKPALDCPNLRELGLDLLDEEIDGEKVSEEEALAMVNDEALACRQDLGKVAELSAYETAASAADIEDLRLALGYEKVNLWGTSYGTWLALETMRRFPEGLRSVVLDAVYPPDKDLLADAPTNAARSIDLLFETCAADEACNGAFPDLRTVYLDTVERLNAEPATFEVTNPLTRESYDVLMTGDNLASLLFQFLYATSVIPSLPQILYDASQGDYSTIAQLLGSLLISGEAISQGQQFSVLCHDEIPFSSPQQFEVALAEHPELTRAFDRSILGELGVQICADWKVGQADAVLNQPVTSDIPTLIMTGEFDPITPPEWGRHVAETLRASYFFEYPGVGHGASAVQGCPQQMMVAFLDDPAAAPDDACLTEMRAWQFVVPSAVPAAIEWVPVTNETMGIEGLVPKGWTEVQPGAYSRVASATDVVTLLLQGAPGTAQDRLQLLTQQLGLAEAPQAVAQREANSLTWNLYAVEVQGLQVDFALSEGEGLALVVLLQSSPQEHDTLYESVYLPAIDALRPLRQ